MTRYPENSSEWKAKIGWKITEREKKSSLVKELYPNSGYKAQKIIAQRASSENTNTYT